MPFYLSHYISLYIKALPCNPCLHLPDTKKPSFFFSLLLLLVLLCSSFSHVYLGWSSCCWPSDWRCCWHVCAYGKYVCLFWPQACHKRMRCQTIYSHQSSKNDSLWDLGRAVYPGLICLHAWVFNHVDDLSDCFIFSFVCAWIYILVKDGFPCRLWLILMLLVLASPACENGSIG